MIAISDVCSATSVVIVFEIRHERRQQREHRDHVEELRELVEGRLAWPITRRPHRRKVAEAGEAGDGGEPRRTAATVALTAAGRVSASRNASVSKP